MRMHDAAYIPVCDKARKTALKRLLDFTPVFAELRLDERQTERFVDVFFGGGGNDLAAAPQSIRTQRKTLAPRERAQALNMRRLNRLREAAEFHSASFGKVDRQFASVVSAFGPPSRPGASATRARLATSSQPRRKSPARVMRFSSGWVYRARFQHFPVASPPFAAAADSDVLENLRLQGGPGAFDAFQRSARAALSSSPSEEMPRV